MRRDEMEMDIRQVALGAAFGAAVAVNAALQSLQDTGSFLLHSPEESTPESPVHFLNSTANSPERAVSFIDHDVDKEDAFLGFCDDDINGAADSYLDDIGRNLCVTEFADMGSFPSACHEQSSQVEEVHTEGCSCRFCVKASEEQNSRAGDVDEQLEFSDIADNCRKRRKVESPPAFLPLLPPLGQTEEAMSKMLQHTTNTVLSTLADARCRRERMMKEMSRVHLPEKETSLNLVNSFIDALVNVSDSLKIVQSALFISKDGTASGN